MKKNAFYLVPFFALFFVSCDNTVLPEFANAFIGEYWMESKIVGVQGNEEYPMHEGSRWTPVSIYEKGGKLYVQTELLGAPNTKTKNPKEVEGTKERPDFVSPQRVLADEGGSDESGIENIEIKNPEDPRIIVTNGTIVTIRKGVLAQTLPIKVKSGSETILNLEPYKPIVVTLISADAIELGKMHALYEYGPMVKDGDVIKWEVDYKDDYTPQSGQEINYDRVIHKNVLYKK